MFRQLVTVSVCSFRRTGLSESVVTSEVNMLEISVSCSSIEVFIFLCSGGLLRCLDPGWPGRWEVAMNCLVRRVACSRRGRTLVSRWTCSCPAICRQPVAILRAEVCTLWRASQLVLLIAGPHMGTAYSRVLLQMLLKVVVSTSFSCFQPAI